MRAERPLLLVHVDAERGFSGGEVQVFLLIEGLRSRGHRCVLVAPPNSRAEAEARARGFETCAVPLVGDLDLRSVLALRRALEKLSPDLVHLHTGRATWLGGIAAWLAGIPAVTTRRMDRRVTRGPRTRFVYGKLVRRAAAISPAVLRCLVDGGVDIRSVTIVPDAVDPARIVPTRDRREVRASLGVPHDEVVLIAVAALVQRKGLDVLIDAVARIAAKGRAPRLWIAGDGDQRDALAQQIEARRLASTAQLLGRREDVGDLLGAADVFVLPAHAEGLGVAALEAMGAGLPVVASRVGGLADAVVDGHTGILVPPGDAGELASALERLIADPDLRAVMGVAGRERVQGAFLPEQMVEAYARMYAEVLTEHEAAATHA